MKSAKKIDAIAGVGFREVVDLLTGVCAGFNYAVVCKNKPEEPIISSLGYRVFLATDNGLVDYVKRVEAPDGRESEYWEWPVNPIEELQVEAVHKLQGKIGWLLA